MTLSERLASAAAERARAKALGTSVEQLRLREASFPPAFETSAEVPQPRILISGSTALASVEPDPLADPRSICPTCGRTGDVGVVDLPGRTSDWSCSTCGTMWRIPLPAANGGAAQRFPR
jgi:hypothetical protein